MLSAAGDSASDAHDVVNSRPPHGVVQPGHGRRARHERRSPSPSCRADWRLERLDGELQRLMLTLEGVMRTEFNEGLTMQAAADEASIEVVAPDRTLVLVRPDGALLAMWGQPFPRDWRPDLAAVRRRDHRRGIAQPSSGLQPTGDARRSPIRRRGDGAAGRIRIRAVRRC